MFSLDFLLTLYTILFTQTESDQIEITSDVLETVSIVFSRIVDFNVH